MTEEELQTLRLMMREEITASEQRTRLVMREEIGTAVQASEQRTGERLDKLAGRVAHMDGRMGELDKIQGNLYSETILLKTGLRTDLLRFTSETRDEIKNFKTDVRGDLALARAEARGDLAALKAEMHGDFTIFKAEVHEDLTKFKTDTQKEQNEIISMLTDLTAVVSDTQAEQRNLENKCDSTMLTLTNHMQTLEESMQELNDTVQKFSLDFAKANRHINERLSYHENSPIDETHPRSRQPGDAA